MKKLSLMMVLVLALGIVGVACSDDDAAAKKEALFISGSTGMALFVSDNTFTVVNGDIATEMITYAWKGTYTDNTATGVTACTANQWIYHATANTNEDWTSTKPSQLQGSFEFRYTTSNTVTNIFSAQSVILWYDQDGNGTLDNMGSWDYSTNK